MAGEKRINPTRARNLVAMSLPRERHAGTVVFITRRTDRRLYRLKGKEMEAAFVVAWAAAAARSQVQLLCVAVLGNHYHAVVFDPEGRLALHLQDFHSLLGRFANALDGVDHRLWDGQQTFVQELVDADAVIAKMAYVMANPVHHGLVDAPDAWQGLLTKVDELGQVGPTYQRPNIFFAQQSVVPASARLETVVPPMCVAAYGIDGFRKKVGDAVARMVAMENANAREEGRTFMGMTAVDAVARDDRPDTPSQRSAGHQATPRSLVAASSPDLLHGTLTRIREFRRRYRAAFASLKDRLGDAVFPPGTWLMRHFYGVKIETSEPRSLAAA